MQQAIEIAKPGAAIPGYRIQPQVFHFFGATGAVRQIRGSQYIEVANFSNLDSYQQCDIKFTNCFVPLIGPGNITLVAVNSSSNQIIYRVDQNYAIVTAKADGSWSHHKLRIDSSLNKQVIDGSVFNLGSLSSTHNILILADDLFFFVNAQCLAILQPGINEIKAVDISYTSEALKSMHYHRDIESINNSYGREIIIREGVVYLNVHYLDYSRILPNQHDVEIFLAAHHRSIALNGQVDSSDFRYVNQQTIIYRDGTFGKHGTNERRSFTFDQQPAKHFLIPWVAVGDLVVFTYEEMQQVPSRQESLHWPIRTLTFKITAIMTLNVVTNEVRFIRLEDKPMYRVIFDSFILTVGYRSPTTTKAVLGRGYHYEPLVYVKQSGIVVFKQDQYVLQLLLDQDPVEVWYSGNFNFTDPKDLPSNNLFEHYGSEVRTSAFTEINDGKFIALLTHMLYPQKRFIQNLKLRVDPKSINERTMYLNIKMLEYLVNKQRRKEAAQLAPGVASPREQEELVIPDEIAELIIDARSQ